MPRITWTDGEDSTTLATGEEDTDPTTLATGEEDTGPTTLAGGEEGGPIVYFRSVRNPFGSF